MANLSDYLPPVIAEAEITNWNTAYGWGDHGVGGYVGTNTAASLTSVTLGDWVINVSGTSLKFNYNGTDVFAVSNTGAVTAEGNVTANGSA
jgi:hypothetical protein